MAFTVYLAGEIHSDWRDHIAEGVHTLGLDVDLLSPVTEHADSDHCGEAILGKQPDAFYRDRAGAGINAIRNNVNKLGVLRGINLIIPGEGSRRHAVQSVC